MKENCHQNVTGIPKSRFIPSRELKDHISVSKECISYSISDVIGLKQDLNLFPALAITLNPSSGQGGATFFGVYMPVDGCIGNCSLEIFSL